MKRKILSSILEVNLHLADNEEIIHFIVAEAPRDFTYSAIIENNEDKNKKPSLLAHLKYRNAPYNDWAYLLLFVYNEPFKVLIKYNGFEFTYSSQKINFKNINKNKYAKPTIISPTIFGVFVAKYRLFPIPDYIIEEYESSISDDDEENSSFVLPTVLEYNDIDIVLRNEPHDRLRNYSIHDPTILVNDEYFISTAPFYIKDNNKNVRINSIFYIYK